MSVHARESEPCPDVVTAAWDVLTAHDELRRAHAALDRVTGDEWASFAIWREREYAPVVAAWASAQATLIALVGRISGDVVAFAERIVQTDITASLSDAAIAAESRVGAA